MIKRSAVFALAILYVVTAMGFVLNLNYCCSRPTSLSLNPPEKSCSMRITNKIKCCETRHVSIRIKDIHQSGPSFLLSKIYPFKLSKSPFFDTASVVYHKELQIKADKRPPPFPVSLIATRTKNCIFRI